MKVKLTKISRPEGLDGGLRTPDVIGNSDRLPAVGEYFEMTGAPLSSPFGTRMVNTSKVMKVVQEGNVYTLNTQSGSVYTVEVLDLTPDDQEQLPIGAAMIINVGD